MNIIGELGSFSCNYSQAYIAFLSFMPFITLIYWFQKLFRFHNIIFMAYITFHLHIIMSFLIYHFIYSKVNFTLFPLSQVFDKCIADGHTIYTYIFPHAYSSIIIHFSSLIAILYWFSSRLPVSSICHYGCFHFLLISLPFYFGGLEARFRQFHFSHDIEFHNFGAFLSSFSVRQSLRVSLYFDIVCSHDTIIASGSLHAARFSYSQYEDISLNARHNTDWHVSRLFLSSPFLSYCSKNSLFRCSSQISNYFDVSSKMSVFTLICFGHIFSLLVLFSID